MTSTRNAVSVPGYAAFALVILVAFRCDVARAAPVVRVEDGFLVNNGAPYHFTLPEGWALKAFTDDRFVEVHHPESGSLLTIVIERTRGDLNDAYRKLYDSLKPDLAPGTNMSNGAAIVGGRIAQAVTATIEKKDKGRTQLRIWFVPDRLVTYRITAAVPFKDLRLRAPDITRMIETFAWTKPRKPS